jgi:curli biogenesis system outer membrane secretion channel CsgG
MRRIALALSMMMLASCAPVSEMIRNAGTPTAQTVSVTDQNIGDIQLEAYNGPKARVAVYQFIDRTAQGGGSVYGWYTPQIGSGMAEMLNDALLQSNRFIVLDRQAVKDVLDEQNLAHSGRVSAETGGPIGQIEGAELLIKGAVTEFEPGAAGAGAGIGLGGICGWACAIVGGVLSSVQQSHVAMIVQVVDAKTSRLLFSTTVEGKANDFNLGGFLGGFGGHFGAAGGLGMWLKTPVEKAIRVAIAHAVKELSSKTPQNYFRHTTDLPSAPASSMSQPQVSSTQRTVAKADRPKAGSTPQAVRGGTY